MQTRLNGHEKPAEQEKAPAGHERVGFAFNSQQWDLVSGLAAQLMESTQRAVLEHYSRYHTRRGFEAGEFIEQIASIAANQAFATARHYVAHQQINAQRIAAAEREAQDSARRAGEELRRKALGLPPESSTGATEETQGAEENPSGADAPRIEVP